MTAPRKLASFLLALVLVFGAGYALGTTVGPFEDATPHAPHPGMELGR